jgi:hypothetical protein
VDNFQAREDGFFSVISMCLEKVAEFDYNKRVAIFDSAYASAFFLSTLTDS